MYIAYVNQTSFKCIMIFKILSLTRYFFMHTGHVISELCYTELFLNNSPLSKRDSLGKIKDSTQ